MVGASSGLVPRLVDAAPIIARGASGTQPSDGGRRIASEVWRLRAPMNAWSMASATKLSSQRAVLDWCAFVASGNGSVRAAQRPNATLGSIGNHEGDNLSLCG